MRQATQVRAVLVVTTAADQNGKCSALLPLAGSCGLDYWLGALRSCSRLQPIADKVLVFGHSAHQQQLQDWAASAGLPSSSVVTTGCSGFVQGFAAAVAACPELAGGYVLAADTCYVLEPGSSMSRLVEAAVVRGEDTITCTVPFEGADLSQLVQVRKQDAASANSRVSIQATAGGTADGCIDTIMGPVAVFAPSSIARLCGIEGKASSSTAQQPPAASGLKGFGWCVQQVQEQHDRAVYAVDVPFYFSLSGEDFALTDAFFTHYKELQRVATREVQRLAVVTEGAAAAHITGSLDELVTRMEALGAHQPPSRVRQQLKETVSPAGSPGASLSGSGGSRSSGGKLSLAGSSSGGKLSLAGSSSGGSSSSLKHMFESFCIRFQQQLAKQAKEPERPDYNTLPPRFQHPEAWQMRSKQQHPCYITSNNDYGAKQPTEFIMPLVWAGIHGKFTETFHGGCCHSMGLKTSVERSRVHRELDYL